MTYFALRLSLLALVVLGTPLASAFVRPHPVRQVSAQTAWAATVLRMAVKDIGSESAFDAEVQRAGDKVVVVDYSTTWCGPCKVIAPKFAEFSEKYGNDAVFLSVVGDASADASKLMKREGVRSVPSFHFWAKKEKIDVVNGANPEAIEAAITKALG